MDNHASRSDASLDGDVRESMMQKSQLSDDAALWKEDFLASALVDSGPDSAGFRRIHVPAFFATIGLNAVVLIDSGGVFCF